MNFSQEQLKAELVKRLASGQITREQAKMAVDRFRADQAAQAPQAPQPQQEAAIPQPQTQEQQAQQEAAIIRQQIAATPAPAQPFNPADYYGSKRMGFSPETRESRKAALKDSVMNLIQGAKMAYTGEHLTTPEIESLPDAMSMPMPSNLAGLKAAWGTAAASPDEMKDVLVNNLGEGASARQDTKGNWIIFNPVDQKEYAIKPGMRASDIPRVALTGVRELAGGKILGAAGRALGLARPAGTIGKIGTGAAREGLLAAGTEATEAATGGSFDPLNVAIGTVGGGIIDGVTPSGAAKVLDEIPAQEQAKRQVAQELEQELGPMAQKVAKGNKKATKQLAEYTHVDPEAYQAAERLGIVDYIQPDHISTNQAFIELQQLAKSQPGSPLRAKEVQDLQEIGSRANRLMEDFGAIRDIGGLSERIKQTMIDDVALLESKANQAYKKLSDAIPKDSVVAPESTISYLEDKAARMGGFENLSNMEKTIYKKIENGATYDFIDELRKDVGVLAGKSGPFADADTAKAKALYSRMVEDQDNFLAGVIPDGDVALQEAKSLVKIRKGIESDMQALFGKQLDKDLVNSLLTGTKQLEKTSVSNFAKTLKAIPKEYRQEFVAEGVRSAFGKAVKNGELNFNTFANWYNGIKNSDQAQNLIFSNLPTEARQVINDLGTLSNAIRKSTSERIYTGKSLTQIIQPAEGLLKKLVTTGAKIGAASAAGAQMGSATAGATFGLGSIITDHIRNRGKDYTEEFIKVLGSPEFRQAMAASVKEGIEQEKAARILARSEKFKAFMERAALPTEQNAMKDWVLNAMRVGREPVSQQIEGEEDGRKQ